MYNKRAFHKHCTHHHSDEFRRPGEHPFKKAWKESQRINFNNPPANVRELDSKYELHLFAPGFEKSDFVIALIDQNLSISMDEKKGLDESWKRQEYVPKGFVRQFELNDKVDKASIEARYENGVLIVSLPKREGFETSREQIEVV